jgi:hypothetical protein
LKICCCPKRAEKIGLNLGVKNDLSFSWQEKTTRSLRLPIQAMRVTTACAVAAISSLLGPFSLSTL